MLEALNLKPEAFGLDISDLSLKIAKLQKKGRFFTLSSFGEKDIKSGIIKNGEIKKEKDLAKIIKEALKEVQGKKIQTRHVICSLPEEKAFLQVIKMPRMSKEDLRSAVIYEAENYIPLPLEKVYLDFQVVPPVNHLKQIEVLIAALPKKVVDPYIESLKIAGLEPMSLEIESLAIARALIKNETTASPLLLIDLGLTRTGFIVFSGNSVRFTSSIAVSSQNFTEIIAKALNVSPSEARKLKIKHGLEGRIKFKIKDSEMKKTIEKGQVFKALIPALTDLVQQIEKYIRYYQTHTSFEHLPTNDKGPEKILLCGGGANLRGLPELLYLELKIPVELGNPWVNILSEDKKIIPPLSLKESFKYTTAFGLALKGMKH